MFLECFGCDDLVIPCDQFAQTIRVQVGGLVALLVGAEQLLDVIITLPMIANFLEG